MRGVLNLCSRRAFASAAPPSSSPQDVAGQTLARLYLGDIQFPSTRHVLWCVQLIKLLLEMQWLTC